MSTPILSFENVSFAYPSGHKALDDVTLHIHRGERVALLGLNGAGKSTLLLHANGLLMPTSGVVKVDGMVVSRKTVDAARQAVGMVFQDADDQLFMPTVEEDVAFGPINMQLPPDEVKQRVARALHLTRCDGLRGRASFELSGGQRRMVAVATVLSMSPSVLVLDEPSCSLDYEARERLITLLDELPQAMLIATHDLDMARRLCSRSTLMADGSIIADGPTQDVISRLMQ